MFDGDHGDLALAIVDTVDDLEPVLDVLRHPGVLRRGSLHGGEPTYPESVATRMRTVLPLRPCDM